MSRVGRKPVPIAQGVKVQIDDRAVTIAGPKGQLAATVHPALGVQVKGTDILVTRSSRRTASFNEMSFKVRCRLNSPMSACKFLKSASCLMRKACFSARMGAMDFTLALGE